MRSNYIHNRRSLKLEMGEGEAIADILVLPFFGQGHLFPCAELCKNFSSHNFRSVLIIPSQLFSSIPADLNSHPLVEILQIPASDSPPPADVANGDSSGFKPPRPHHEDLGKGIKTFLSERYIDFPGRIRTRPVCVVIDVMMSWSREIFTTEKIPIVAFFTSGACASAMEYASWKAHAHDMDPSKTRRILPELPESMALSYSDLKRRDRQRDHGGGRPAGGPLGGGVMFGNAKPGEPPKWLDISENFTAILINTCSDLEGQFIEYLARQLQKPVFGVGPLLPEKYWKSAGSVLRDRDIRSNRESNYTEEDILQWLDSNRGQSVVYISFGSEVGPTLEEYDQLALALGESNWPFVWVIQPGVGRPGPPAHISGLKPGLDEGYYPHGLQEKVGDRGLVIKGWAPQLLILSHPSTGGFLSHCGWNSTMEGIGRGVPFLAWPIRGDQFYNAKLVVKYLRVGIMVFDGDDISKVVKKGDILKGIEGLMEDGELHDRAAAVGRSFEGGFPASSVSALEAVVELLRK